MHTVKIGFANSLETGVRKEVENQAAFAVRDFKSRSNIVRASPIASCTIREFLKRSHYNKKNAFCKTEMLPLS
ncbi:hypothetical protein [Microcoleus sp.]|uniref:hypothetical protein n=1 Tax=Microcoleus sp. TaxID=44472 RepID=UPI003593F50F